MSIQGLHSLRWLPKYTHNYIGIEMYVVRKCSFRQTVQTIECNRLHATGAYKYHGPRDIFTFIAPNAHVHNFSKRVCYTHFICNMGGGGVVQCHVNTCITCGAY